MWVQVGHLLCAPSAVSFLHTPSVLSSNCKKRSAVLPIYRRVRIGGFGKNGPCSGPSNTTVSSKTSSCRKMTSWFTSACIWVNKRGWLLSGHFRGGARLVNTFNNRAPPYPKCPHCIPFLKRNIAQASTGLTIARTAEAESFRTLVDVVSATGFSSTLGGM